MSYFKFQDLTPTFCDTHVYKPVNGLDYNEQDAVPPSNRATGPAPFNRRGRPHILHILNVWC